MSRAVPAHRLAGAMADITISLPDGSQRTLPAGATATTVARALGRQRRRDRLQRPALRADAEEELRDPPERHRPRAGPAGPTG